MTTYRKKLIEVALPLDEINAACAREKSIRHGHPSTLHLWWARRPLAVLLFLFAALAVAFAFVVVAFIAVAFAFVVLFLEVTDSAARQARAWQGGQTS